MSGQGSLPAPPGSDAARLVTVLRAAGHTIAVAESLTGGAVTSALVAVPGASFCVRGGIVAYASDLKADLLGVPVDVLAQHGAVHPAVALAMAHGVRERLGADYGIATTGVAGPEWQDACEPGTFHVAVEGPDGAEVVSVIPDRTRGHHHAQTSRSGVRAAARDAALALALRRAGDAPEAPG